MKRLGVFLLPPGWDASPSQGYPSIKFAGTHLYTWVERGTLRVKCPAQEHNTMSPGQDSNPDHSLWSQVHKLWGLHTSWEIAKKVVIFTGNSYF